MSLWMGSCGDIGNVPVRYMDWPQIDNFANQITQGCVLSLLWQHILPLNVNQVSKWCTY